MRHRFKQLAAAFALGTLGLTMGASAQETIKIGEINSYKAQPASLSRTRKI